MAVPAPTDTMRWRCVQCGNLTRFDVVRRSRVQEFVHVDLAGAATVEERTVLDESVEHVICRWCGAMDRVELVEKPVQHEAEQGQPAPCGAERSQPAPCGAERSQPVGSLEVP